MIKVLISGANGKMGQTLKDTFAGQENMVVVAGVDKYPRARENNFPVYESFRDVVEVVDIVVDFSRPETLPGLLDFAREKNVSVILATTGYSDDDKDKIRAASKEVPLFFAANMSLGVNMQMTLAKYAAESLGDKFDIEIVETHHNQKVDAPSGTALAIARHINSAYMYTKKYVYGRSPGSGKREEGEIGIHAIRGGAVVGEHDVMFLGGGEVLSIKHTALSKQVFAEGAVRAAQFLSGKGPGLYNMQDIIEEANIVSSVYYHDGEAILTLFDVPYTPSYMADIFKLLGKHEINVDIISQTYPRDGVDTIDVSFSLSAKDVKKTVGLVESYKKVRYEARSDISKLTMEGIGMVKESGVAARMFAALAKENIKVLLLTTSETKIACCIGSEDTQRAIGAVTQEFGL